VLDKAQLRNKTMLTDEKLEHIWSRLQTRSRESLLRLSQETSVSVGCASKATYLINFRSYSVGVAHELKATDASQRI
jgi:hypothetical protein